MKYVVEYRGTAPNMFGLYFLFFDGQTTRWEKGMENALHFNTKEDAQYVADMIRSAFVVEYVAKNHIDAYDRAMGVI